MHGLRPIGAGYWTGATSRVACEDPRLRLRPGPPAARSGARPSGIGSGRGELLGGLEGLRLGPPGPSSPSKTGNGRGELLEGLDPGSPASGSGLLHLLPGPGLALGAQRRTPGRPRAFTRSSSTSPGPGAIAASCSRASRGSGLVRLVRARPRRPGTVAVSCSRASIRDPRLQLRPGPPAARSGARPSGIGSGRGELLGGLEGLRPGPGSPSKTRNGPGELLVWLDPGSPASGSGLLHLLPGPGLALGAQRRTPGRPRGLHPGGVDLFPESGANSAKSAFTRAGLTSGIDRHNRSGANFAPTAVQMVA
jgi:hypothetical protein